VASSQKALLRSHFSPNSLHELTGKKYLDSREINLNNREFQSGHPGTGKRRSLARLFLRDSGAMFSQILQAEQEMLFFQFCETMQFLRCEPRPYPQCAWIIFHHKAGARTEKFRRLTTKWLYRTKKAGGNIDTS
jgi:hypothetical protein